MLWTHPFIEEYLYATRVHKKQTEQGVQVSEEPIREHVFGAKRIQSGFFSLPESENVSAILFSNRGTVSKFNRMGKLAGFGDPRVKMVRKGKRYDHNVNSIEPVDFAIEVEEGSCTETWSEGASIFHNPNAKYPLDAKLFPTVGH